MSLPTDLDPAPGVLLVAPPDLRDSNFSRTVALLCEHDREEGSFGLILNQNLDLTLGDALDGEDSTSTWTGADRALSLGGPVQPNTLHFLHRYSAERVPDAQRVFDGVQWGGNFATVKSLVQTGEAPPDELRFFLGYAGWGPGQLQSEIDRDGWLVLPGDEAAVFADHPDTLWRDLLRGMGGEYALLANYPEDPRMN